MIWQDFEEKFKNHMQGVCEAYTDPSHDMLHVNRVVTWSRKLAQLEGADPDVVVPAAYLHDCVYISKTDARRSIASTLSAKKAMSLLEEWGYPEQYKEAIAHAVAAHSFSSGIRAETLEAQVVQDADRLDAMGSVGMFRCFAFSGLALRPFYESSDPFCKEREPDDSKNTLDHFFTKLLHLQDRLNTEAAKQEGEKRLKAMKDFLQSLQREMGL